MFSLVVFYYLQRVKVWHLKFVYCVQMLIENTKTHCHSLFQLIVNVVMKSYEASSET